ncbi:MAG: xanthine dehydrogenase family protein molybdopterin-binding subunit [Acidobacteria bacterium]|nr:xanthine dehydrogenase family protein molybdopterin-binding subunit [Acidobacteriota bacterium]
MPDEMEGFEPERYELREPPVHEFALSRREFVEVAGAGLLISVSGVTAWAQRGRGRETSTSGTLESRLHIAEDGMVTLLTGKVEVGQGSRTELAMAAAEEMRLPLERVRVVMADTDLTPNDGASSGSRTTPSTVPAVRSAAAAARELLLEAASRQWQMERGRIEVRDGAAIDPGSNRRFGYPELARSAELAAAFKQALPAGAAVTPVKEWRVLGTPHYRLDGRDIVTGAHRFPSDIQRNEMLYGSVLRPPSYGATLVAADLSAAKKMPGVTAVREGSFVGCAAPTSFAARKAVAAIAATAQWETREHPSSERLFTYLKERAVKEGGDTRRPRVQRKGSVEEGLAQSTRRLRAVYQVPYIQHAPMEPRGAVAEWEGGRLTVWTGTQNPLNARGQLAQAFHLAPEKVRVIVPDTGGAFGGKHTGECAIEAARLAREAGRPVSLRWTRAEEFMWAYFRPAGLFEVEAGLDAEGLITAWDFTNYNAGTAGMETPYRIPHTRTRFLYSDSPLREGSYRGIAATANHFARECCMDELAGAAGKDPLEFRLANLDNARLKDVLLEAAKRFRWQERRKQRRPGMGLGLACGTEKGSYVAACVEVEANRGKGYLRVREISMAFECGAILNPANLRAQVEGAIIQGLGGALTEEIEFENGKLNNGSFAKYPVPRFRDVPPMEIALVNRPDLPPVGAGETPIVVVAPAIANAVFDATGVRARSMPVRVKASTS